MALTSTPYNGLRNELGKGTVNLSTAVVKLLLASSAYVPDFDADKFVADLSGELTTNGASRKTLTTKTWTQDNAIDRAVLKSDAVQFTATGGAIVARRAILFIDTGNDATSLLLCAILLDATPADVTIAEDGILRIEPDTTNGWLQV